MANSKQKIALTVLGSGVLAMTKERNPSGFILEADNKKILLDAGHGVIRRMVDFGFNFQDIDLVFISHFHTDHFGDAFSLVHSRWVDDNYAGRVNKPLLFLGPEGIKERFSLWRRIFWVEPNESYPVEFKEGISEFKIGNIEIETFPVFHVKWFKSVGAVIKYGGKKIVYTGDIGSDHDFKELAERCKGADLVITEASYEKPTPNHYSIGQIKDLVRAAGIKKVLAVHIRPQQIDTVEKVCREETNLILGKDGLKIEI